MGEKYSHSPGPWKVASFGNNSPYIVSVDDPDMLIASPVVKSMPHPKRPHAEANATLIAAAPELKNSLMMIVGALRPSPCGNFMYMQSGWMVDDARKVLKKAVGEES